MRGALDRAVSFLAARQLTYGEFPSYRFDTPSLQPPGKLDSSPFVTTFVLYALALVDHPEAMPLLEKGVAFLLSECEEPGVWRYWTSRNGARIVPDLDDTSCASFVLQQLVPDLLPDNRDVLLRYRTEQGVFQTWICDGDNDVDSVVNANVLLYLGERHETKAALEVLCRLVEEDREGPSYWYYLDALALYYAISRARYHGVAGLERCREAVLRKVLARQQADGSFGDELATALGLCTLLNFRAEDTAALTRGFVALLGAQQPEGGWPSRAFYSGPRPPGPLKVWWGSEELTTALCLEALAKGLKNAAG
jgi:hypothetical protein